MQFAFIFDFPEGADVVLLPKRRRDNRNEPLPAGRKRMRVLVVGALSGMLAVFKSTVSASGNHFIL